MMLFPCCKAAEDVDVCPNDCRGTQRDESEYRQAQALVRAQRTNKFFLMSDFAAVLARHGVKPREELLRALVASTEQASEDSNPVYPVQ